MILFRLHSKHRIGIAFKVLLGSALCLAGARVHAGEQPVAIDTDVVQDVRAGESFTFTIHPGLPDRTFKLIADPTDNTIKAIEVYVGYATKPDKS